MADASLNLQKLDVSQFSNQETKAIVNYLASLEENLRYIFNHIDEDNMSSQVSGTFKTADNKTITIVNGLVTKIV